MPHIAKEKTDDDDDDAHETGLDREQNDDLLNTETDLPYDDSTTIDESICMCTLSLSQYYD